MSVRSLRTHFYAVFILNTVYKNFIWRGYVYFPTISFRSQHHVCGWFYFHFNKSKKEYRHVRNIFQIWSLLFCGAYWSLCLFILLLHTYKVKRSTKTALEIHTNGAKWSKSWRKQAPRDVRNRLLSLIL
jgi:hypothetical protein